MPRYGTARRTRRRIKRRRRNLDGTFAKSNPRKKKTTAKKRVTRKKPTRRKKVARKTVSRKRSLAAKKAAATRKRKAAIRSAAAKKAARTRKRRAASKKTVTRKRRRLATARKTVTRKRRVTPRKKVATKRRRKSMAKMSKSKRRAAALKGWRKRRRKGTVRMNPARKTTRRRRRKSIGAKKTFLARPRPKARRVKYTLRRRTRKGSYWYTAKRNPLNQLKGMLKDGAYSFVGLVGIRALSKVFEEKVLSQTTMFAEGTMKKVGAILPSIFGLLAAAYSGKVIKGQPRLVAALQTGAAIGFFDSVLKAFVSTESPYSRYLFPLAEYVPAYPQVGPITGMGLDVQAAMAMDEYVADTSHQLGFDVEEALAGDKQALQRGYAGGSLHHTVFSS